MLLEQITQEVRACGPILLSAGLEKGTQVKDGQFNNLVTEYDKKVQSELRQRLLRVVPQAHFVGEEEDVHESIAQGAAFIVDPIDGTTNFIRGLGANVISVAMTQDGELDLGVVYNPYTDEMFCAQRGKGAFCNGKPIHVSDRPLQQGLTLFGSAPYYEQLHDRTFRILRLCFERSMDVRRFGSAAYDLCLIASGRAEIYFELRLQPWDYAAGTLIVREAGGTVTPVEGGEISLSSPSSVLAYGSGVDVSFLKGQ